MDSIEQKIDAVLRILKGEPFDQSDKGMIGEVIKMRDELNKMIDWKNRTVAWAIGVAFGGGSLITFIITTIIDKHK